MFSADHRVLGSLRIPLESAANVLARSPQSARAGVWAAAGAARATAGARVTPESDGRCALARRALDSGPRRTRRLVRTHTISCSYSWDCTLQCIRKLFCFENMYTVCAVELWTCDMNSYLVCEHYYRKSRAYDKMLWCYLNDPTKKVVI